MAISRRRGREIAACPEEVRFDGHAVEARVYAEDPEHGFLPSTGKIVGLEFPSDVRVESGVEAGGEVTPYYDPMIAKIITHAPGRAAALDRMAAALDRTLIAGVRSNLAFLGALCRAPAFRDGKVDTGYIDRNLAALGAEPRGPDYEAAAAGFRHLIVRDNNAAAAESAEPDSPWDARDGFQLGRPRSTAVPLLVDGENADAVVDYDGGGTRVEVSGASPAADAKLFDGKDEVFVLRRGRQTRVRVRNVAIAATQGGAGDGVIKAPMHGKVLELFVSTGETVAAGQRLAVIEAMKMEHTLRAPFAGRVAELAVTGGQQVVEGAQIVVIERTDAG